MNILLRLADWGEHHHPRWVDIIRIALGIFLLYKGIDFLFNMSRLTSMMTLSSQRFNEFPYALAGYYVVFAHLLGGLALVLGMFTRTSCLLQIPILLGAVLLVNSNPQFLQPYAEKVLSLVVLLLLIYFAIAGNGPLSLKFPKKQPNET